MNFIDLPNKNLEIFTFFDILRGEISAQIIFGLNLPYEGGKYESMKMEALLLAILLKHSQKLKKG